MIEFLCPNEHKIRCPDDKAGLPAKCPRCGVSFRIPDLEELSLGISAMSDVEEESAAAPAVQDSPAPPEPPSAPAKGDIEAADAERQIEFLCPNGHHLHGPASLQGLAGECPECRSRFRIPVIDEPEIAPEPLAEPELASDADSPPEDETGLDFGLPPERATAGAAEPLEFLHAHELGRATGSPVGGALSGGPGTAATAHPLAALFAELWAARDGESRVELHLESGGVLTPDGYLRSHSMHDYAVLVTKDPDGRSTATIVPWNSVSRIILRALKEVPGEVVR